MRPKITRINFLGHKRLHRSELESIKGTITVFMQRLTSCMFIWHGIVLRIKRSSKQLVICIGCMSDSK